MNVKDIILVHGALSDGSVWSAVIPLLEAKGFRVVAVQLATSLTEDIAITQRALDLETGPVGTELQKREAERAKATVLTVDSGHLVLSHPAKVAAFIEQAATSLVHTH